MSGSWNQGSRQLIAELKETLRMHFKGMQCFAVDMAMTCPQVSYHLPMTAVSYGGVVFDGNQPCQTVDLTLETQVRQLDMAMLCQVLGQEALFPPATVQAEPLWTKKQSQTQSMPLLQGTPPARQVAHNPIRPATAQGLSAGKLQLGTGQKSHRLPAIKFKKATAHGIATLLTQAKRASTHKNVQPIQHKPIPAHRFTMAQRNAFRERLAQKFHLPMVDIQLVGIYDRIYLGLYQSLTQTEDGLLLGIPKVSAPHQTASPAESEPMYFILGQSLKHPDRTLQVIIPMSELKPHDPSPPH